jgi:solute carrier family 25 carnitine/acylcarnitine transporter 20/29
MAMHPFQGIIILIIQRVFLAGAFSGLINSFLSCPIELVKIRLQNQAKERVYNGNIDLIQKIWKNYGWRGFYRGFGMTVLRETPSYGVYFASYEILTKHMESDSSITLLTAGGLAGVYNLFNKLGSWMDKYIPG